MELRRSPHLVLYWRDDELLMHNYALGGTVAAPLLVLQVLEQFPSWKPLETYLATHVPETRGAMRDLIDVLIRDRWLIRRDEPLRPEEAAAAEWSGWNPAAGFFHSATRRATVVGFDELLPRLDAKAKSTPKPAPGKSYPNAPAVAIDPLIDPRDDGEFPAILRRRRTWRRFAPEPLPSPMLATLLHFSAGVQRWAEAAFEGTVPLKTSPSGGARHPIELYVAAQTVEGLAAGLYHFDCVERRLERLPGQLSPFSAYLPEQPWYANASALIFMTAVFERTRWRYPGPRAYRAVLLEAGHVCQTFCLTATWLGLAPFCSMALDDGTIEADLGLDGISEAVLYAAGVGCAPALDAGELPGDTVSIGPLTGPASPAP